MHRDEARRESPEASRRLRALVGDEAEVGRKPLVPCDAAVGDGFPRAVDGDGAGARAHAELFFLLVLQRIEVAEARDQLAHVAHLDGLDPGDTGEQVVAELSQVVAVGGGEAHAGDDDTAEVHDAEMRR